MKAVSVLSTPTKLCDAGHRDFVHIYNNGSETIFLSFDGMDPTTLTTANGFPLVQQAIAWYENQGPRIIYNRAIYAIAVTGPVDVRVGGAD